MYKPNIYIFSDPYKLGYALAQQFQIALAAFSAERPYFAALSGGRTPGIFYETLARAPYAGGISWEKVHFFWGDERCVPPDDEESNFRLAQRALLGRIDVPEERIHRIRGEEEPEGEARRYEEEIKGLLPRGQGGFPRFDWVFLGMGADGHIASLYPASPQLQERERVCLVAEHPQTGQKRVSLSLPAINAAGRIAFLVTGHSKAAVTREVLRGTPVASPYPAAKVSPADGLLEWYLDEEAARLL